MRIPRKTKRMQEIEVRFGEPIDKLLRRLYYQDKLTLAQIGGLIGVDTSCVSVWMFKFGIETRRWMLPEEQDGAGKG